MNGAFIITAASPEFAQKTLETEAAFLGYRVTRLDTNSVRLKKGNLIVSIFIGAFVAYCNFQVNILTNAQGQTQVDVYRNTPWWTGVIGVGRVKKACHLLAIRLVQVLQDDGHEIIMHRNS